MSRPENQPGLPKSFMVSINPESEDSRSNPSKTVLVHDEQKSSALDQAGYPNESQASKQDDDVRKGKPSFLGKPIRAAAGVIIITALIIATGISTCCKEEDPLVGKWFGFGISSTGTSGGELYASDDFYFEASNQGKVTMSLAGEKYTGTWKKGAPHEEAGDIKSVYTLQLNSFTFYAWMVENNGLCIYPEKNRDLVIAFRKTDATPAVKEFFSNVEPSINSKNSVSLSSDSSIIVGKGKALSSA